MMTAKELKEVSIYGKAKQEAKIFLPIIETINQKMLENASLGYFDYTMYTGNIQTSDWASLGKSDFYIYLRSYYEKLGYKIDTSFDLVEISWGE